MHQRLITRIGGYKFLIHSNGSFATGMFVAENEKGERTTFMDLPFELRSTYESVGGQIHVLLAAALSALDVVRQRADYSANIHEVGESVCGCDNCDLSSRLFEREFLGRGIVYR
jgi:hypothetical protein